MTAQTTASAEQRVIDDVPNWLLIAGRWTEPATSGRLPVEDSSKGTVLTAATALTLATQ